MGGKVCVLSGMVDHAALIRVFYEPFEALSPGMVGLEDCKIQRTHLKPRRTITEKYLARHVLRNKQALEQGESDNICRLPGVGNPAGGLTKVRTDMAPLFHLPESGKSSPDPYVPSKACGPRKQGERGDPVVPAQFLTHYFLYLFTLFFFLIHTISSTSPTPDAMDPGMQWLTRQPGDLSGE